MLSQPYRPKGYKVVPRSAADIRAIAVNARRVLGIGNDRFKAAMLLDLLCDKFNITIDVVSDESIPAHIEAQCFPSKFTIEFPERTWEQIENGSTRGHFTLAHELGHLILQHDFSLHREASPHVHKPFQDSEWQADQFAAEFLMPLSTINGMRLFQAEDLAEFFDVSVKAAEVRLAKLRNKGELTEGKR